MKKGTKPRQLTDVLMLPVDTRRAEELGRLASGPAPPSDLQDYDAALLELVLGIAAIEDAEQRQGAALAAAVGIYSQSRHCQNSLAHFMADYYRGAAQE
ncbi:MAG TPA: hypothetical protein VGC87_23175 [Pyrinomonadaceae bacterium]|jgi:hypothetical protein